MAATDIDDQVSGRKVRDEIDHLSPRFQPRLGVGLRDPVVRRADIGLGPTHTWDETIPSNKVSVRARVVPGGSPRPYAFGFPLAKEAEWWRSERTSRAIGGKWPRREAGVSGRTPVRSGIASPAGSASVFSS